MAPASLAIDGECAARGNPRLVRRRDDERAEPAHLFFENANRGFDRRIAQRIRTHQFGEQMVRCASVMRTGRISKSRTRTRAARVATRPRYRRVRPRSHLRWLWHTEGSIVTSDPNAD